MANVTQIMDDVLELPRADRSYLAKKLLESLDRRDSLTVAQQSELDRRSSELSDGKVNPLSLEDLKRDVAKRLA